MSNNIKIKAGHLDSMMLNEVQTLLRKPLPGLFGYRLARVVEKLETEAKIYFKAKQELIDKHSDKEKSDKLPDGKYHINKSVQRAFIDATDKLGEEDLNIGIEMIELDPNSEDMPELSAHQWKFLLPLIREKK